MMRKDMHKVIIELPRSYSDNPYRHDGRTYRNRETTPSRIGMKAGYYRTKWLSDNLGPLIAFLEKRAGRPWNSVYRELCVNLDRRNTVKRHLLEHLEDLVAIHARWEGDLQQGRVWIPEKWGPQRPLERSDIHMYVHPRTGILSINGYRLSWRTEARKQRQADRDARAEKRRVISATRQLHSINGIWFVVELGRLVMPSPTVHRDRVKPGIAYRYEWDCVENRSVSLDRRSPYGAESARSRLDRYGDAALYAKSKRQLNRRELHTYAIANKARTGLVRFWHRLAGRFASAWSIFPMFGIR